MAVMSQEYQKVVAELVLNRRQMSEEVLRLKQGGVQSGAQGDGEEVESVSGYDTKIIIIRHVVSLYHDCIDIATLLCYVLILCVTVMGLPSYLTDAPHYISSYKQAGDCAKKHCKWILYYFCEVLGLIFAFKTYRIAFRASMFVILVPGACIAEVLSFVQAATNVKFAVGFVLWMALFAGSIRVGVIAYNAGFGLHSLTSIDASDGLLIMSGCLFAVLIVAAGSLLTRGKEFLSVDSQASRGPELTWSHILAVLCGPFESLQLSAVVMYFFWSASSTHRNSSEERATSQLGSDSFSSSFMVWGDAYERSDYHGYFSSTALAVLVMLFWCLLVSVPLVLSSASRDEQRNWEKAMKFKNSALYDLTVNLISRLFTVWLIATLMRSASCVTVDGQSMLSTARSVSCGGDRSGDHMWASRLAVPLLTFFIITSAVLHSDDAVYLKLTQQYASPQDAHGAAVQLLAGDSFEVRWVSLCSVDCGFFIGWAVIYALSLIPVVRIELKQQAAWMARVKASGLDAAVDKLLSTIQSAVLDQAVISTVGRNNDVNSPTHASQSRDVVSNDFFLVRAEVLAARSTTQLARILIALEETILAERLTIPFVLQRTEWIKTLCVMSEEENALAVETLSEKRDRQRKFRLSLIGGEKFEEGSLEANTKLNKQRQRPPERVVVEETGEVLLFPTEGAEPDEDRTSGDLESGLTVSSLPVAEMSPQFRLILEHINLLSAGLRPSAAITQFSRPVFTLLLSNKLPRDVCWVIYSYILNPSEICAVLNMSDSDVQNSVVTSRDSARLDFNRYRGVNKRPLLTDKRQKHDPYIQSMLQYAMSYVSSRREMIFNANVKQNQQWEVKGGK
eukprot:gene34259-42247_t